MKSHDHFFGRLEGFAVNEKNHLTLNSLDLVQLAQLSDRPLYVLNELVIRKNIRAYRQALSTYYPAESHIFYASKVFLNLGMCYLLNQEHIGLDVCSEGELFIANQTDFPHEKIIFHGNNKSQSELEKAIDANIFAIMVDNACELEDILKISESKNAITNVMIRINPVVEVDTHAYIATGVRESKFGVPIDDPSTWSLIELAFKSPFIHFKGIHFHLGSQITELTAYSQAIKKIISYIKRLHDKCIHVEALNIGGGLGAPYTIADQSLSIDGFIKELCQGICEEYQLNNLEFHGFVFPWRQIFGRTGVDQRTGQEGADAVDQYRQAALDLAADRAGDEVAGLECGFQAQPGSQALGLVARQAGFAETVFQGVDRHRDVIADADFELAGIAAEFLQRNETLRLQAGIDHDKVHVDADHFGGNHFTSAHFLAQQAFFKQSGKTFHGVAAGTGNIGC
jgi:diaminopimelate decarboxylase